MFSENSKNKILICVPTYNAEKSLEKTIKSILRQNFNGFDVLILDNKSIDETFKVAQNLKDNLNADDKIHIVLNEKNIGRIGNWNKCLDIFRKSNYSYLKFVFAGDTLENNCLAELLNVFEKNPKLGFVSAEYYVHNSNDKTIKKTSFLEKTYFKPIDALKNFIKKGNWVGAPIACMFSKKGVEGIKFMDGLEWSADWKFYIDITTKFDSFYLNKPLGTFYSLERKYFLKHNNSSFAKFEELYIKYYALEKYKSLNLNTIRISSKDLWHSSGKIIFPKLSFRQIFVLIIYKLLVSFKNVKRNF